jgi:hypothetical protein
MDLLERKAAGWLFLLMVAVSLHAAPPKTKRQFDVLVVPPPGTPRPLGEIAPELIEATLDGQELRVVGIKTTTAASENPLVIFIDSRGTRDDLDARLFDEVYPLFDALLQRRNTLVLIDGCDNQRSFDFVNFRSHADVAVLKDQKHTMLPAYPGCESYLTGVARLNGARLVSGSLDAALRGVNSWFPQNAGPVRVVQLSGDFRWIDESLEPIDFNTGAYSGSTFLYGFYGPTPLGGIEESLSERSVTVFPLIIPKPAKREGASQKPDGWNLSSAKLIATRNGGFASVADNQPGEVLRRLLRETDEGYLVRIEAPANGRRWSGEPRTLRVVAHDAQHSFAIKRTFVVSAEATIPKKEEPFERAFPRIVVPQTGLRLDANCPTASEDDNRRSIRILYPESIANAYPGEVTALIEYLNPNAKLRTEKQILQRKPGSDSCIPLRYGSDGDEFRLVVLDDQTGWVGAVNGKIEAPCNSTQGNPGKPASTKKPKRSTVNRPPGCAPRK